MLLLITETQNIETALNDELPPPLPIEAKMNWLSSIAIAKGDMTKARKNSHVPEVKIGRKIENAWSRLPANTIVGDMRITPNMPGLPYAPAYRFIYAKFDSHCEGCSSDIERGDLILWYPSRKTVYCRHCDEFKTSNEERITHGLSDVREWRN